MARTLGKSKGRASGAGKAKSATRGGKSSAKARAPHAHEEDQIDGCDFQFLDSEATPDAALPPARGGVEIARGKRGPGRTREDWYERKKREVAFSLVWLPQVLFDAGLKVAVQPGWQSRGRGDVGPIKGVICHHTAGPLAGNMPSLEIVTKGRQDLPGPLAQLCLGRDGTFFVVAAGRCNHAGRGDWQGLASGNTNLIGIEAENTGLTSGPKADPWPAVQMDAYRRGVAAILKRIRANAIMGCGHKEYALPVGRKSDPTFDMNDFRLQVASIMAGTAPLPSVIPAADSAGRPTLRRGATSDLIKEVQTKVGVPASGNFDANTEATVRQFQRDHGLVPDGIVGPRTWATLDMRSPFDQ